jgi:hypothetical protein
MSEFRQNFMKNVEQAHNTNLAIVERYKEGSARYVDGLSREMADICHVKIHFDRLRDGNKLRTFLEDLKAGFNAGMHKHTLAFADEILETHEAIDKRQKHLLREEGVGAKDIYEHLERDKESNHSSLVERAGNLRVKTGLLDRAQSRISGESGKIIKEAALRKRVLGVFIPVSLYVVLLAAAIVGIILITRAIMPSSNEDSTSDGGASIVLIIGTVADRLNLFGRIEQTLIRAVTLVFCAVAAGLLLPIIAWAVYYRIISLSIKQKMIRELEQALSAICYEFADRKHEIQEAYSEMLTAFVSEISQEHFMRYKPLIELAAG